MWSDVAGEYPNSCVECGKGAPDKTPFYRLGQIKVGVDRPYTVWMCYTCMMVAAAKKHGPYAAFAGKPDPDELAREWKATAEAAPAKQAEIDTLTAELDEAKQHVAAQAERPVVSPEDITAAVKAALAEAKPKPATRTRKAAAK